MPVLRSIALALLVAIAPPARGAQPPVPLQYNLAIDASVTGAMLLSVGLLAIYQPELLPAACRWCEPPAFDSAARDALVWKENARTADTLSTVLVAAVPASALTYLLLSANGAGDFNAGLVDLAATEWRVDLEWRRGPRWPPAARTTDYVGSGGGANGVNSRRRAEQLRLRSRQGPDERP